MPLSETFHAFHGEMLEVEKQMAAGSMTPQDGCAHLKRYLERRQRDAEREGGQSAANLFEKAKYAMAALADEHFLRRDSAASKEWQKGLLESALFETQCAGEQLFKEIDDLRKQGRGNVEDLARLYLAVLGLDFQGKFLGEKDAGKAIERIRHELFRIIYAREPIPLESSIPKIVPAAYEATAEAGQGRELPYLRPWIFALAMLFIVWIAAGHVIWTAAIAPLEPLVQQIVSAPRPSGGRP